MNAEPKILLILSGMHNSIFPGLKLILIISAAAGIGLYLLRAATRTDKEINLFDLVLAVSLGIGLCGYAADIVYMLQIINMNVFFYFLIIVGLIFLILYRDFIKKIFQTGFPFHSHTLSTTDHVFFIAGWLALGIAFFKLYIANVVPVWDNDSICHYANLSKMIAGGIPFDDALLLRKMPITDLNRVINMLYAFGYVLGGEGSLHLMNFLFITISLLLVHLFCSHYLGIVSPYNPLPILIGLNIFELSSMGGLAKVDCGVAMLEISTILAIISRERRSIWFVPVFMGIMVSARINTLRLVPIYLLIVMIGIYISHIKYDGLDRAKAFIKSLSVTSLIALAAFVIASPTYIMNELIYGNPFFPFLNDIFGKYKDYYDYVLFSDLKYDVEGPLGPILIYIQACSTAFIKLLNAPYPDVIGVGLGPLFIFAPFAWSKKLPLRLLYLFYFLGYLSWVLSANTYRTLLGVSYAGVILISFLFSKWRKYNYLYFPLYALIISFAIFIFLQGRVNSNQFSYFSGRYDKNIFYQEEIRKKNPLMLTIDINDAQAISEITGRNKILSLNIILNAHPDFINISIMYLGSKDLKAILNDLNSDKRGGINSERYAYELALFSPFIREQYKRLENILWPQFNDLNALDSRHKKWEFVKLYYDARYNASDTILQHPEKIVNVLKIQQIKYLITPRTFYYNKNIYGLKLLMQTENISLFSTVDH